MIYLKRALFLLILFMVILLGLTACALYIGTFVIVAPITYICTGEIKDWFTDIIEFCNDLLDKVEEKFFPDNEK